MRIQVTVDPEGGVAIHSRTEDDVWTRHATGSLGATAARGASFTTWPPRNATPLDTTGFYAGLDGFDYGPAFQGLQAAWRVGDDVYAEVALDAAEGFGIHPALLDSALHAAAFLGGEPGVPFSWQGSPLHADGATTLQGQADQGRRGRGRRRPGRPRDHRRPAHRPAGPGDRDRRRLDVPARLDPRPRPRRSKASSPSRATAHDALAVVA